MYTDRKITANDGDNKKNEITRQKWSCLSTPNNQIRTRKQNAPFYGGKDSGKK